MRPAALHRVIEHAETVVTDGPTSTTACSTFPGRQPGLGGVVHHSSGVIHAMRSVDVPLLALWFLWTSDAGEKLVSV